MTDLYEGIEFLLAHTGRFFSEPMIKIFGDLLILLMTDPASESLRCQSFYERNSGLTFRRSLLSACCVALYRSE